ncbi:iron ABC transporter permease [Thermococcus sp. GR6]|uniref:ABC transporter permease n=1 Tax=Thermococcus sp. GR6 TaxID=1638256 RepID=UPI00142FC0F5|nr:iron ABC transporter permease [Thermococcus sp. GR6]NJE41790.1 iron ABC transporter permease [Thermococcus sp. GR6]
MKVSKWSERLFGTPIFDPVVTASFLFPLLYLVAFLIIPVLAMLAVAFQYNGQFSLHWFTSILTSDYYISFRPEGEFYRLITMPNGEQVYYIQGWDFGVILNSILVSISVMILTTILGTVFAFVMARYDFPGKNIVRILLFVPLLVTPFVNVFIVKKMFLPTGLINWIFYDILHIFPHPIWIDGLVGVIVAQTLTYYPIVYLNAYASFINIDPTLEEQAENLGSGGVHLFRTVTFPLALPGIAAGATLVGIFSLEDLAAPIVFQGNGLARKLMSFQIYSAFTSGFNVGSPQLAALALMMLLIAVLMFLGIRKYVSMRQYAMLSKGGRWKPRVAKPKSWQAFLIYFVVLPILFLSIFPQIGVVLLAFSEQWGDATWPSGFTLKHIQSILTQPDIERVIINSVMYSTAAIVVIILLSLTASYASSRFKKSKLGPVLDSLATIPIAVPGIVIAMSYFFFAKVFPDTPLDPTNLLGFNPAMVLILAYSIRRLPFAARSISAGIQQVHVSLEEAALNLGASRWKALTGILIPLILLNLLGGAMLSFVYCMSETSVGITLGSINPDYYPITARMVELITGSVGGAHLTAALGVFLMTVQIIAIVLANLITKQRYSFIGLT